MTEQTDTIAPPWLTGSPSVQAKPSQTGRFTKGQSGNPVGRPLGLKNRKTVLLEQLQDAGQEITNVVIEQARSGDLSAAALVLQRLVPPLKAQSQTVTFALDSTATITEQAGSILSAVARGDLDPETGRTLVSCLSTIADLKVSELAERLAAIEERLSGRGRI